MAATPNAQVAFCRDLLVPIFREQYPDKGERRRRRAAAFHHLCVLSSDRWFSIEQKSPLE